MNIPTDKLYLFSDEICNFSPILWTVSYLFNVYDNSITMVLRDKYVIYCPLDYRLLVSESKELLKRAERAIFDMDTNKTGISNKQDWVGVPRSFKDTWGQTDVIRGQILFFHLW